MRLVDIQVSCLDTSVSKIGTQWLKIRMNNDGFCKLNNQIILNKKKKNVIKNSMC